jgi:opacity protein-like surface antigen
MKKLMMIAAFVVACVSANAQNKVGQFSIQPKLGVTITSVTGDLYQKQGQFLSEKKTTAGLAVGVEAEYQVTDLISVAGGVNYSMQGCAFGDTSVDGAKWKDGSLSLGYINIPLVANFYVFKGLALKTGVQFGFMTNAKEKLTTEINGTTTETKEDIKDGCKKFDFAIPVGASWEFKNGIVIDARYNIGLTKIFKDDYRNITSKNSVFVATVGYKFKL